MKFLILSTILAAGAAQTFLGQPAQLVLRRSQNRAILQLGQDTFGSQSNQFEQSVSGSQGSSGSKQGISGSQSFIGAQQGISDAIPVFLDSTQSQGFSGSRQDFSTTSQSGRGQSSQGFESPRQGSTSSQANFRSSQQQFANPQQNTLRNQQDLSSFSQSSSISRQQQSTSQPSGNQFQQGSASSQFSSPPRASSQFDNRQLRSGESTTNQEEVGGVFESLNLPSGATLLLGDINTSFDCVNQPYGYYADQQNACRVFHICYPALFSTGRVETYQYSFICGEGTQFDQKEMTCVKESDATPCSSSKEYYYKNGEFGLPEEHANL